ncbi:ATP-dependent RNA helicase mss116 [Hypoxylon sp. NC1633]|nr:ATP-dependent RNA helicase mss116 [Hypoxylon sp. NC1633]
MLKSSLQRQARLGNLAYRQLPILATRQIHSRPLLASYRVLSQAALHANPLRQVASRLYSQESAATDTETHTENEAASLYDVTRFEELARLGVNERIIRAITDDMKYDKMTDVQSMTINPALKGTDLVAQARTGTGKTLGFLIPVFQRVLNDDPELFQRTRRSRSPPNNIRALILSPTRELAEQIGVEARKLAKHTGIVVQTAVGGTRKRESLFAMQQEGCHVLVATPGRLVDILSDTSTGVQTPNLHSLVLDEADRMLDDGFERELREILDLLPDTSVVDRQTLLFSATIPRDVVHLAKNMVKTNNFEFVQTISPDETPTHERVPQNLAAVPSYENWFPAIMEIADKARTRAKEDSTALPFKAIVFFSNTATVQFAYRVFRRTPLADRFKGIQIYEIHSKLTQMARTKSAEDFRRAKSGILFSSDVTARGMDFPNVSHVIQVGLPPSRDQYIHRIGRTGRAGAAGEGWLLLAEAEIPEARTRLYDLPIKPNRTLESAQHVVGEDPPPPSVAHFFDDLKHAYGKTYPEDFKEVYHALLGQKFGRHLAMEDVLELLNNWCLNGLGWTETPAMNPHQAKKRGWGSVPGLRLGFDEPTQSSSEFGFMGSSGGYGGFGDRSGSRGDRFGSRNGRFNDRGSRSGGFNGRGGSRDNRFGDRGSRGGGPRATF